jgi:cytochrome c-type biogenesis protein CcmH/NrfG
MKLIPLLALAGLPLAACATAADHPTAMVEEGYERGALASAAIARQDWQGAEATLARRAGGIRADDPARLINLGRVYMATGRTGEALSAWRLALAAERHYDVEVGGGAMISTRRIAQTLLARHDTAVRSATR